MRLCGLKLRTAFPRGCILQCGRRDRGGPPDGTRRIPASMMAVSTVAGSTQAMLEEVPTVESTKHRSGRFSEITYGCATVRLSSSPHSGTTVTFLPVAELGIRHKKRIGSLPVLRNW